MFNPEDHKTVRQSQMRRDEWRLTDPVYLLQRVEIYQDYLAHSLIKMHCMHIDQCAYGAFLPFKELFWRKK